jgi:dTDP-4-amino-4,6-dideoxygalactose transaminase
MNKMHQTKHSRRGFIKESSLLGVGSLLGPGIASELFRTNKNHDKHNHLALLGGAPVFDGMKNPPQWPEWPLWIPQTDESQVLEVLRSGVWSRSKITDEFESAFAAVLGAKHCLTTVNGTNALICALKNLNIGGGDEVIVPPYTFIATIQAILQVGAMPVFVDINPETFQIDTNKIEKKITPQTRAILPVHICGLPADMNHILAISKKHNLVVVEDACQAHLAEIDHKKVGTLGDAGCFSFQNSKNLPIGEGGAIVSNNGTFIDQCYSYHNYGIAQGSIKETMGTGTVMLGTKLRLTEYQAAIGLAQLKRLEEQTKRRNENAEYLKSQLELIPGIIPYKLCPGVTRAAFHLFPFRYKKEYFRNLSRGEFIKALRAEGVPCSGGYTTLNDKPYLKNAFGTKNFKKLYTHKQLDWHSFLERNQCPENDLICNDEAVWFTQNMLLGTKEDMNYIALAIQKIYKDSDNLVKNIAS